MCRTIPIGFVISRYLARNRQRWVDFLRAAAAGSPLTVIPFAAENRHSFLYIILENIFIIQVSSENQTGV